VRCLVNEEDVSPVAYQIPKRSPRPYQSGSTAIATNPYDGVQPPTYAELTEEGVRPISLAEALHSIREIDDVMALGTLTFLSYAMHVIECSNYDEMKRSFALTACYRIVTRGMAMKNILIMDTRGVEVELTALLREAGVHVRYGHTKKVKYPNNTAYMCRLYFGEGAGEYTPGRHTVRYKAQARNNKTIFFSHSTLTALVASIACLEEREEVYTYYNAKLSTRISSYQGLHVTKYKIIQEFIQQLRVVHVVVGSITRMVDGITSKCTN